MASVDLQSFFFNFKYHVDYKVPYTLRLLLCQHL